MASINVPLIDCYLLCKQSINGTRRVWNGMKRARWADTDRRPRGAVLPVLRQRRRQSPTTPQCLSATLPSAPRTKEPRCCPSAPAFVLGARAPYFPGCIRAAAPPPLGSGLQGRARRSTGDLASRKAMMERIIPSAEAAEAAANTEATTPEKAEGGGRMLLLPPPLPPWPWPRRWRRPPSASAGSSGALQPVPLPPARSPLARPAAIPAGAGGPAPLHWIERAAAPAGPPCGDLQGARSLRLRLWHRRRQGGGGKAGTPLTPAEAERVSLRY
jgi:hypothetical protein